MESFLLLKRYPVTYHNILLTGNQHNLNKDKELKFANDSEFRKGLYKEYKVSFLDVLALLLSCRKSYR